jgi:two-component system chemotaxis response regulator CheB
VTAIPPAGRTVRLLLADDSAASRGALEAMLSSAPGLFVAGVARDGEEALRKALQLGPDLVVLDLQMPRLDGFSLLRLLMAQRPTPVLVLSSLSRRSDVFKALELGALDFVAKPSGDRGLEEVREELVEKCRTLGALRVQPPAGAPPPRGDPPPRGLAAAEPAWVLAIGASTGGPQALQRLLAALPGDLSLAVLVAQHMPEKFTAAFAERLAGSCAFSVQEATDGDLVAAGRVLVAPGGRDLELRRDPAGLLRAAILDRARHGPRRPAPSVDRLLGSAARVLGPRACALVLTGMGLDGREGATAVRRAGGLVLAEAAETAVVYGMPQAAAEAGAVDELLPLPALAPRIERFARGGR